MRRGPGARAPGAPTYSSLGELIFLEGRGEGRCCSHCCRCSCGLRHSDGLSWACAFSRKEAESSSACTVTTSSLRCCTSSSSSLSSRCCTSSSAALLLPLLQLLLLPLLASKEAAAALPGCRAQGVLGHWGLHPPSAIFLTSDAGLQTLSEGSAEEHGIATELDRRFRRLGLRERTTSHTATVAILYEESLRVRSSSHPKQLQQHRSEGAALMVEEE